MKHLERLKRINHGDCDMCGQYSVMLVDGICPKQVCQRYAEEGKSSIHEQIAQSGKLASDYAGGGYA